MSLTTIIETDNKYNIALEYMKDSLNETQILSILSVYSHQDNSFNTRHEGEIDVIYMV